MRTTPMLEQYFGLKREVPDALLLYRLGDFFELFFEDAEIAAPLLGLVLTARHKDSDIEAPMCGIPHHAAEGYIAKLVAAGKKVAIGDQVEPSAKGKALVARKIVRIVTPGTVTDPERLDARRPNELAAIAWSGTETAISFLDLSTGDWSVLRLPPDASPEDAIGMRLPREVVCFPSDREEVARLLASLPGERPVLSPLASDAPRGRTATDLLLEHFRTGTLDAFGLPAAPGPAAEAAAAVLTYARGTQRASCAHLTRLRAEHPGDGLVVDAVTAGHLELFRTQREGARQGSLLQVLDETSTSFGARALRRLLERPLGRSGPIEDRLDAIEELLEEPERLEDLARALATVPDVPRLLSRLSVNAGTPRDLALLGEGLARAARVLDAAGRPYRATLLRKGGEASPEAFPLGLADRLRAELFESAPLSAKEGGIFRDGVDPQVDELRALRRSSSEILAGIEAEERAARSIPTLRVKFNQVFGHVFEVPGSARAKIPEDALKRQTLANVERYATRALIEADEKLRSADAKLFAREEERFRERVADAVAEAPGLLVAVDRLGLFDALLALARVARRARWVRPTLFHEPVLEVLEGRHPVVEALRPRDAFVPNDTSLSEETRVVVLTGPNMGGKSTYLRQNALLVLLAHMGSYVPAARATVGLCDRIFTRVGASDSLARGESTFLVEMAETAHILRHATKRSLVVLDEIGRGTSTFDGLSLAWAIAERLAQGEHQEGGPWRVLFATHYHELTELALVLPPVVNRTMTVKEWKNDVVFLRKVVDGVADRSYGVQVARLAGIPEPVLARAREILANLERQQLDVAGRPRLAEHVPAANEAPRAAQKDVQLDLFRGQDEVVLEALRRIDVPATTPLAALNLLASFQHRLRGEG